MKVGIVQRCGYKDEPTSAAQRTEALAALVNEETAALLERLALRVLEYGVGKGDARQGRELAARIKEVLDEH